MPSQWLTIAEIGGEAADETMRQIREWAAARVVGDSDEISSEQWPKEIRLRADAWANALKEHGHEPPVLFFAEYVDLWSVNPPFVYLRNEGLVHVVTDRYELSCMNLPFSKPLLRDLNRAQTHGQFDEDRLFATLLISASRAWDKIVDRAVLVFVRRVFAGSVEDHEIAASLQAIPAWMRRT